MEAIDVISQVEQPWRAGMVVVPKLDGRIRICVDLTKLNQAACHRKPKNIFKNWILANPPWWAISIINNVYYTILKVPLQSTPIQHHFCLKIFPKKDVRSLIRSWGSSISHRWCTGTWKDTRTAWLLIKEGPWKNQTSKSNIKCWQMWILKSRYSRIKFLGQMIDEKYVSLDHEKTQAILQLEQPNNVADVRHYLGMLNQLSPQTWNHYEIWFLPRTSGYGANQQRAFEETKNWSVHPQY